MYTVIGHPISRVLRVIFALEELGQPYDINPAVPGSDEARKHSPWGKIPSLVDGDVNVTDSVAILHYLADKHMGLTHAPGTAARAHQDAVTMFAVAELDAALWLSAKHKFVLPEEMRVPQVRDTAQKEFTRAMGFVETYLGDDEFVAGDILTIPDILISHCAGWAVSNKWPLPDGRVGDYLKSIRKRPAMQRVFEQLEPYR